MIKQHWAIQLNQLGNKFVRLRLWPTRQFYTSGKTHSVVVDSALTLASHLSNSSGGRKEVGTSFVYFIWREQWPLSGVRLGYDQ